MNWKDDLATAAFLTVLVVLGHNLADLIMQLTNLIWKEVQHVFQ